MYPGFTNSPSTTLTGDITDSDTTIPVAELSVFPAAPNLAVIGTGEDAETILYTGKSAVSGGGNLTGVTREIDKQTVGTTTTGEKLSWVTGDVIGRNFTHLDMYALQTNIDLLVTADTTKVAKADFDAYTILAADTDDTPVALTVGASTIVGRKDTGGIVALTPAEVKDMVTSLASDMNPLHLQAYDAISADADAAQLMQTDMATYGFPLPYGIYQAGAYREVEKLAWISHTSDSDANEYTAKIEWTSTTTTGDVSWILYAVRVPDAGSYNTSIPLVATIVDSFAGAAYDKQLSAASSEFVITGTGGTILWYLKRGATSDTLAGSALFVTATIEMV